MYFQSLRFLLVKPEIRSGLNGHLACMQTYSKPQQGGVACSIWIGFCGHLGIYDKGTIVP